MSFKLAGLLELEASRKLNLTLTEERTVSTGRGTERRIVGQRSARQVVERSINSGHLGSIKPVESFRKYFQLHSFVQAKAPRKPAIEIPNIRLLEEIARQNGEAA